MRERCTAFTRSMRVAAVAVMLVTTVGAGCARGGIPADVAKRLQPVRLTWWGVQETAEEARPLIDAYRAQFPHVDVTYRKLRYEEYERALLDALSEGDFAGPDIFSIPSTWVRQYQTKLLPAPERVTMPHTEVRGTVKKETFAELRDERVPAPEVLANTFIDAVVADAVLPTPPAEGVPSRAAVYGLPLAADTLALYANRDLLNAAGIPEPARTWTELQTHVPRLTRTDADGSIVQSGVALGTAENVQRSFDIVSLLMMQNGAQMTDARGVPTFHLLPQALAGQRSTIPAADALLYYTDYARPGAPVATWDASQPDSLEAFLQGRVAYMIGYSYHLPIIKSRAPRINLSVSGIPHIAAALDPESGLLVGADVIEGTQSVAVNYANLWFLTVSERTEHPQEAWSFIARATTTPTVVAEYLAAAKRPTALRALIAAQLQDTTLRVFANQLLTARTWYRGRNASGAEATFAQLIADVRAGVLPIAELLKLAAQKVQQTL